MPSYLTTVDVATRLGVSLDTVRRWLRSGELKGTPFGRAGYRIEDADFQAFLQHRQRHGQGETLPAQEQGVFPHITTEMVITMLGQELHPPLVTTHSALQQAHRLLQRALDAAVSPGTIEQLTRLQNLLTWTERQLSREVRQVGYLVDASRIEADAFELAPTWCNLLDLVREAIAFQQELAVERRFEVELPDETLVAVIVDVRRIKEALLHYLANALTFAPAEYPIRVSVVLSQAQARVSVRDSGPGIPEGEQQKIWECFQQGTRPAGLSGRGLGLGLYLTRTIIQLHRGEVGVESQPGKGAHFWFTLPLARDR
jgi:excisionase family DNA binding protein